MVKGRGALAAVFRGLKSPGALLAGIAAAGLLGFFSPGKAAALAFLGPAFVGVLVALSPFVMFFAVASAFSGFGKGLARGILRIIVLFMLSLSMAGLVTLAVNIVHPLSFPAVVGTVPGCGFAGICGKAVEIGLPVPWRSNYLVIFMLAAAAGGAARLASPKACAWLQSGAKGMFRLVSLVMVLAPFGIFGIVCQAAVSGVAGGLSLYGPVLGNLAASVILVFAAGLPALYWLAVHENPFPLLAACLKGSAFFAFLTRSSITNVPVNLKLARRLGLDDSLSAAAIPLGAVFHMPGAVVTLVTFAAGAMASGPGLEPVGAVELFLLSAGYAVAASGVPAGGLMMLPVLLGALGFDPALALQLLSVGLVTGVVQDALGTALNSSSDVFLAALACRMEARRKRLSCCQR